MLDDDEAENAAYPERPMERFQRSAVGSVLAAGMFGLRDVLEPEREEQIVVEQEAPGQPFADPIVLRLDPDHPEDSIVMVRRPAPPVAGE